MNIEWPPRNEKVEEIGFIGKNSLSLVPRSRQYYIWMGPSCVFLIRANAIQSREIIRAREIAGLISLERLWRAFVKRGPTTRSRRFGLFRLDSPSE